MVKNIWQYQSMLSKRLLQWAGVSIVAGFLMRGGRPFWRQLGGQFVSWGVINALIAWGGQIMMRERVAKMENPGTYAIRQEESAKLGRLLWINAGLDVLYMFIGWRMMRRDKGDGAMKGTGLGVILQGAFLMVFDIIHAVNLPNEDEA